MKNKNNVGYGDFFIKYHNKELIRRKKLFINLVSEDFGSPFDNGDLFDKYRTQFHSEINKLMRLDKKEGYDSSLLGLCSGFYDTKNYKFSRIKNIIEIDCYNKFKENKQYSQFHNFEHFLEIFSQYLRMNEFLKFIQNNRGKFFKAIEKENIKDFFIINRNGEVNTLITQKEKPKDSNPILDILSEEEKLYLLNVVLFDFLPNRKSIPKTEIYRLLIICSKLFQIDDLLKIDSNHQKYKKLRSGLSISNKPNFEKKLLIRKIGKKLSVTPLFQTLSETLKNYEIPEE